MTVAVATAIVIAVATAIVNAVAAAMMTAVATAIYGPPRRNHCAAAISLAVAAVIIHDRSSHCVRPARPLVRPIFQRGVLLPLSGGRPSSSPHLHVLVPAPARSRPRTHTSSSPYPPIIVPAYPRDRPPPRLVLLPLALHRPCDGEQMTKYEIFEAQKKETRVPASSPSPRLVALLAFLPTLPARLLSLVLLPLALHRPCDGEADDEV
jgi:hypothetical protein